LASGQYRKPVPGVVLVGPAALPGDCVIERGNVCVDIPVTTSIFASLVLAVICLLF
jgi:hypothetical protein